MSHYTILCFLHETGPSPCSHYWMVWRRFQALQIFVTAKSINVSPFSGERMERRRGRGYYQTDDLLILSSQGRWCACSLRGGRPGLGSAFTGSVGSYLESIAVPTSSYKDTLTDLQSRCLLPMVAIMASLLCRPGAQGRFKALKTTS
ncbi:hypothetical protein ARMGADRAFT_447475 [Armillaria gallica]|uniref:Uncharacterized protein n=1 Tax=Armillaria gallica TaxID=47427 RepID=A0A2H3CX52_ARMGA|nr:hypothetical protein ARMGADRAFT_447475 [Armillaria gallica]